MGRNKLGDSDWVDTLLCIKHKTSKNLQYSTGKSTQDSVMACMGKGSLKNGRYIYITYSLCCTLETNTTL